MQQLSPEAIASIKALLAEHGLNVTKKRTPKTADPDRYGLLGQDGYERTKAIKTRFGSRQRRTRLANARNFHKLSPAYRAFIRGER